MYSLVEIISFIEKQTGSDRKVMTVETDIFCDLGVDGDDCDEFMGAYCKSFNVDLSGYLWYFHSGEEPGFNIGGLFFKPPNLRVSQIPITPLMLLQFANEGKWNINYPPHKLPKYRYDMMINFILLGPVAVYLLYRFVKWLF